MDQNTTEDMDNQYLSLLKPAGKTYMAPVSSPPPASQRGSSEYRQVSPWCKIAFLGSSHVALTGLPLRSVYAHLPASTGYPKNYYLYSDTLFPTRWQQILDLSLSSPDTLKFVEIITWNDWTESSLISSYKGQPNSDGNYLWSQGFDHSAMMDLMGPFIAAYKKGSDKPVVEEEMLVYWYRPSLKDSKWVVPPTLLPDR